MHSVLRLSLGLVTAALTSIASAATVNFSGALSATDPVFNRPLSGTPPAGLSAAGTAVSYDLLPFYVTAADSYTLQTLTATLAPNTADDTFIVLYQNAFNPASPLTNALAADDDAGAGSLSLITSGLNTNTQYFLVVTSFFNGAFGAYTGSIGNAGAGTAVFGTLAAAVPEPSTAALLLGGLALAAGAAARRRNAG